MNIDEEPEKGRICKICDNKFFMREQYDAYAHQMDENDETIEQLATQYDNLLQELQQNEQVLQDTKSQIKQKE